MNATRNAFRSDDCARLGGRGWQHPWGLHAVRTEAPADDPSRGLSAGAFVRTAWRIGKLGQPRPPNRSLRALVVG